MDIQTQKLGLIEWITKLNDQELIGLLGQIMESYHEGNSGDISMEERKSIERGIEDFKNGNIHSHNVAREVYEKYL